jgi:alpha-glucosidase
MPPALDQDPLEKNLPGRGLGRDPARTPMQWEAGPNAGFCPQDAEPWLPVANDYRRYNVATERGDQRSMLNLHRRLLELRRAEPALAVGSYAPVEATGDLLAYAREEDGRRFIIVLNFGHEPTMFDPGGRGAPGRIVLTTHLDREGEETAGALKLRGDEGVIIELTKQKLAR